MAGFFRPSTIKEFIQTKANEKVYAVSPLGFTLESRSLMENLLASFGRHSKRKPLTDLVSGLPENEWPSWMKPALEAAQLAPSAVNRQPWRFKVESNAVVISVDSGRVDLTVSKRLDCGIAMLHFEVAALRQGIRGVWQFLDQPQVAQFRF
jgi:hypothetical protein